MTNPLFTSSGVADSTDEVVDLDKLYETYVGEGKQFLDPKVLLKSKLDSNSHISRIEQENAQLRVDLAARVSLEEALKKLTPSKPEEPTPVERKNEQGATTLSPEDIQFLINKELSTRSEQSQVQRNQEYVVNKLAEVWGDNFQPKLKARAKELGLQEDFLANLAQTQPQAFLKIVDPKPTPGFSNPIPRTTQVGSPHIQDKTWAHYQKMRRENPKLYHSIPMQKEMFAQAQKLGDTFYRG